MGILKIDDVTKTYGDYKAVNHVSFDMPEGSIFGMLGPNGAGKTSLIRIITTITRADSGTVSKGMQQKIQFISTVVHEPRLLILDEPFSGLDPINANLIKDEIYELNRKGTSIIFSTHRMEQVEEICEHIVLINKGENVLQGKVADIKNQFKDNLFKIEYDGNLPPNVSDIANVIQQTDKSITVKIAAEEDSNHLLQKLLQTGVFIHSFNEILPSLNEIFIKKVESLGMVSEE